MASFDGLDRMKALLSALGNPESGFRVIHIAGTNGKGSTAVMTASVLEKAGYSAGLYTSPHLENECERVQIWDGEHHMIEQAHFDELKRRAQDVYRTTASADDLGPLTVFEVYTAAAYLYFAEKAPDYVVLETGLGGRLDSTNTIEKPLVSVITQVGLDHTAQLGNTIYRIAREKAGIIKAGVPVVSQTEELAVRNIIKRTAQELGCELIDVSAALGGSAGVSTIRIPELLMKGEHQKRNAAAAVCALQAAGIELTEEAIRKGLSEAYLPGRFDILNGERAKATGEPVLIVDGAHNPDAIAALTRTFSAYARANKIKRTTVIFGCMKDKNCARMVQLLTGELRGCRYMTTAVDYERAEDPERIAELISSNGRSCVITESVGEAYGLAMQSGCECVLACGSIYLAGELCNLDHKFHS